MVDKCILINGERIMMKELGPNQFVKKSISFFDSAHELTKIINLHSVEESKGEPTDLLSQSHNKN